MIESIANELLDNVVASGRMDMIADFAGPLPAIVTAKMLGVPVEDHGSSGPGSLILRRCLEIFSIIPPAFGGDHTKSRSLQQLHGSPNG